MWQYKEDGWDFKVFKQDESSFTLLYEKEAQQLVEKLNKADKLQFHSKDHDLDDSNCIDISEHIAKLRGTGNQYYFGDNKNDKAD